MKTGHTAVTSSQISSFAYNADTKKLDIVFSKNGDEYRYSNVPQSVIDELNAADSFGSTFSRLIKKNPTAYPFVKI